MNRRNALLSAAAGSLSAATFFSGNVLARVGSSSPAVPLTPPKSGPILVAVVVGNGATVIDFAGPWEVFQDVMIPERGSDMDSQMPFRTAMISDKKNPLEATDGMLITPRFAFSDASLPQPNVIVIGAQGEHTPAKIAWIREAGKKADVVMSVCTGAFLLAKTGMLDGRQATTHHDFYDSFEKRFPKVQLVRGPRYVENAGSNCCTAGGLTSGIELALRVAQRYFGDATAARTAYYMEYNRSPARPARA